MDEALASRDDADALVLLAHQPAGFQAAADKGVGLMLSGHTHGGQVWPQHMLLFFTGADGVAGTFQTARGDASTTPQSEGDANSYLYVSEGACGYVMGTRVGEYTAPCIPPPYSRVSATHLPALRRGYPPRPHARPFVQFALNRTNARTHATYQRRYTFTLQVGSEGPLLELA